RGVVLCLLLLVLLYFFFFQAEDGIRDLTVTGVQTCALPISARSVLALDFVIVNGENAAGGRGITGKITIDLLRAGVSVITSGDRSEERRVGKECRCRWSR